MTLDGKARNREFQTSLSGLQSTVQDPSTIRTHHNRWFTQMQRGVKLWKRLWAAVKVRHRVGVQLNRSATYQMDWFQPKTLKRGFDVFLKAFVDTRSDGRWAA